MWETLPVNLRFYLQSLLGETKPITEKDFSKSELDVIRKQGKAKYENEPDIRRKMAQARIKYNFDEQNPQTLARMWDQTYEKQPISPQVTYVDYRGQPDGSNWLGAIGSTIKDPAYRIGSSLGRFGLRDNGDHYTAYDNYSWNGDFDKPLTSLTDLWNSTEFTKPTQVLNGLAELYAPKVNRPVNIRINK